MITSKRKFGVEIEFSMKSKRMYDRLCSVINIVHDGSLRDAGVLGGEYVSPILQGKTGEEHIHTVCDTLKKYDASGDHPAVSVHVHLDGKVKSDIEKLKTRNKDYPGNIIAVSKRLSGMISDEALAFMVTKNRIPDGVGMLPIFTNQIDNVTYYSCTNISRHPLTNYTYYYKEINDRFKWLRNMLYFYTQYSSVMENIVSPSRRFGNMYCVPLDKSFSLPEIESVKDMDKLRKLWYRGNEQNTHYDDSRYHNVNLHSYWHKPGTVEIRSHGGTIDPNKILLWVKLHQKIADKLENLDLEQIKSKGDLNADFVEFVEEPLLQEYVKRLLGYYSNIKVTK